MKYLNRVDQTISKYVVGDIMDDTFGNDGVLRIVEYNRVTQQCFTQQFTLMGDGMYHSISGGVDKQHGEEELGTQL